MGIRLFGFALLTFVSNGWPSVRLSCEVKSDYSQEQGDYALTSLFIGDPFAPLLVENRE